MWPKRIFPPGDVPMVGNLNADASEALAAGETRDIEQYYHPFGFETVCGEQFQKYISGTSTREEVLTALTEEWLRLVNTTE